MSAPRRWLLPALLPLAAVVPAGGATFTATEMMKLQRLSDPQVSPDGREVLYTATDVDLAGNGRNADLWVVPLAGGEARRLTSHAKSDTRGRWSPDGRRIAFVSTRAGAPQVFLMDTGGGEPRQATSLPTGAGGVSWADAATLLVTSDVFPECDDAGGAYDADCNRKRLEAAAPSSARVYDHLLYRHWDTWEDGRRTHLLVVPVEGGTVRDLTPGARDVPPFSLGGPDDYAVSPDGREVAFVRKDDPVEAISTNGELFVVPLAGGPPRKVSGSPGYDGAPLYSPDGALLAFRAQPRAGYESDRWRLMVYDRRAGALRNLTEAMDRHVESFAWSPDSRTLFFLAAEAGREPIFAVPAAGGPVRRVADGTFGELQAAPGGALVATKVSLTHPAEVYRIDPAGAPVPLTRANDARLAAFSLRPGESVTYRGAQGKDVQAWVVKPPDFDPARKYPLLVLIHGGPQGVWPDGWSFRWNAQVFASAGHVVFMPNPRGSIGWGQEFVDDVSADWGGRAYEDVLRGTDFAESLPYVERGRTAAAGASYGGYLVNWIAGHTDRYRALVSHDGVFDLTSMYGATEELWFVEWEFKGPFWEHPEAYARWSPSAHVRNFKTPTLVIHGEQDHRVPLEQGLGLFTALQRRGVPSRLVVFPDEGHWVLKPANSVRWYEEVIGWLGKWLTPTS
ncbi:MAG TPA: S9 family peptidase [Vicinamibacteria bacterium]|nr:S9 family peptidase [Vicinamibacteria bacterium]